MSATPQGTLALPWYYIALLLVATLFLASNFVRAEEMKNPFYAMDTAFAPPFRHPKMTAGESFDMIKELGFAGVGWTEKAPADVKSDVDELEKRGLKMYAIYFHGKVTPDGELTVSEQMPAIMDVLKGHQLFIGLTLDFTKRIELVNELLMRMLFPLRGAFHVQSPDGSQFPLNCDGLKIQHLWKTVNNFFRYFCDSFHV